MNNPFSSFLFFSHQKELVAVTLAVKSIHFNFLFNLLSYSYCLRLIRILLTHHLQRLQLK